MASSLPPAFAPRRSLGGSLSSSSQRHDIVGGGLDASGPRPPDPPSADASKQTELSEMLPRIGFGRDETG